MGFSMYFAFSLNKRNQRKCTRCDIVEPEWVYKCSYVLFEVCHKAIHWDFLCFNVFCKYKGNHDTRALATCDSDQRRTRWILGQS